MCLDSDYRQYTSADAQCPPYNANQKSECSIEPEEASANDGRQEVKKNSQNGAVSYQLTDVERGESVLGWG